MSGEINGTTGVLYRVVGTSQEIVGQLEMTRTVLGAPINTESKTDNGFVTLMNGELSMVGSTVAGSLVYNNDAEYKKIRVDAQAGNVGAYALDIDGVIDNLITFNGIPNGLSDAVPVGDKITTSITFLSTGE